MNFTEQQVQDILDGEEVQVVRLVNEGEFALNSFSKNNIEAVCKHGKISFQYNKEQSVKGAKWQVGKDYSACIKNKQGWFCPKCKDRTVFNPGGIGKKFPCGNWTNCHTLLNPLRVVLTKIEKTELTKLPEKEWHEFNKKTKKGLFVNPDVWVLTFKKAEK